MAVETVETPAQTPAESFSVENTSRASERFTDVLPATYDEKDDMDLLRAQLNKRKRPIYAGVAFLCVVVIGVSIAVSSGSSTADANTSSGITIPEATTAAPVVDFAPGNDTLGGVHGVDVSSSASASGSSSGGSVIEDREAVSSASNSSSGSISEPSEGPILPYKDLGYEWKNPANWEYASGAGCGGDIVNDAGVIVRTPEKPIRTKGSWGGEKIVYIQWTRTGASETNIWMLNEEFRGRGQYAKGNGWPYWGELDIFEMMGNEAKKPGANAEFFKAFGTYGDPSSYAWMTMHTGGLDGCRVQYEASHAKSAWYKGIAPMTGASAAQFSSATTSMAIVWGSDGGGQFIQLLADPIVTAGGKVNGQKTYDVQPGGVATMKIYNNNELHWGAKMGSSDCLNKAGHNAATGFPFFEKFFLILEEQGHEGGSFTLTNLQVFKK